MPKQKYTSEYFFEQLQKIRQIVSTSKNYRTLKELMSTKSNMMEFNHLNTLQGLEK